MTPFTAATALDAFLDPVVRCWTPEVAEQIANARPDATTESRLDELRQRANEGQLSTAEREEYAALIDGMDLMSLVKAKARAVLAEHHRR